MAISVLVFWKIEEIKFICIETCSSVTHKKNVLHKLIKTFMESQTVSHSIGNINVKIRFIYYKLLKAKHTHFCQSSAGIFCILITIFLFFVIRTLVFLIQNYCRVWGLVIVEWKFAYNIPICYNSELNWEVSNKQVIDCNRFVACNSFSQKLLGSVAADEMLNSLISTLNCKCWAYSTSSFHFSQTIYLSAIRNIRF